MTRIIIDTDPGQDDAVTILLALASPEIELLGITTVAGNVSLGHTTENALKTLELAGRTEIPVHPGADRPLRRAPIDASHVHGRTGFEGVELPAPRLRAREEPADSFLVRTLMENPPGSITLCCIGPLTNIALALQREPRIAERIERIVTMIGAWSELGNITPCAEFNAAADPDAAALVFASGVPIVVVPLDVTHQLHTSRARMERLRALPGGIGAVVADWFAFEKRFEAEKFGTDGGPLHDPNTVLWLLRPDLYGGRKVNVMFETESALTAGMSVIDWWGVTDRPRNALVLRDVDADGVYAELTERLGRLERPSA
ncbi:nucleoside hydrolase [Acetobacteraceae bacterium KSS8]|uniref:Nucleoside hydrolase n=1 Tax=Endosaccharibacter trunci TaxID=2812733 RepID=A0ABT1W578_9PROT|nr:nucleoside hydrolase [Acetobacteraceae bacterium KSS8]